MITSHNTFQDYWLFVFLVSQKKLSVILSTGAPNGKNQASGFAYSEQKEEEPYTD